MHITNLNILIDGLSKGGAETLLLSMLPALRSRFTNIRIYHLSKNEPFTKDFESYASVERLPIWKLPVFLAQLRGQVIYAHLVKSIFAVNIMALILRKRGNKVFCHEHTSPDFYAQQSSIYRKVIGRLYQFLLNANLKSSLFYYIVSTYGAQKRCLDAGINAERLVHFPNSFSNKEVKLLQNSRDRFISKINENKLNCFTISRVEPIKQIDWGMRALAQIAKERPHLRILLHVCGDGTDVDRLRELAVRLCSENLNLDIRFQGFVPSIMTYLAICDVYLLPSAFEGFPLSLTAAAISGIDCVVTPFGGATSDLKENFPNVVESDDMSLSSFTKELTLTINKLISGGGKTIAAPQQWKSIEEITEELIKQIDRVLQSG